MPTTKQNGRADSTVASAREVLEVFTQIMRGEAMDDTGQTPKVSERAKAAELLGKRYGLFADRDEGAPPKAEVAQALETALSQLEAEHGPGA